jgi:hypothetical protein
MCLSDDVLINLKKNDDFHKERTAKSEKFGKKNIIGKISLN